MSDHPLNEYLINLFLKGDEASKSILEIVANHIASYLDNMASFYDEEFELYLDDYDRDSWNVTDREKFRQIIKSITEEDIIDYARYYRKASAAFI